MVWGLLKCLKEGSFYKRKKNYKNMNFAQKRKIHVKKKGRLSKSFLDKEKADIYEFLGVKGDIFQCMKLVER